MPHLNNQTQQPCAWTWQAEGSNCCWLHPTTPGLLAHFLSAHSGDGFKHVLQALSVCWPPYCRILGLTLITVTPVPTSVPVLMHRLPASAAASISAASSCIISFTLAVIAVRTASTLPSKAVMAAWWGPRAAQQMQWRSSNYRARLATHEGHKPEHRGVLGAAKCTRMPCALL